MTHPPSVIKAFESCDKIAKSNRDLVKFCQKLLEKVGNENAFSPELIKLQDDFNALAG